MSNQERHGHALLNRTLSQRHLNDLAVRLSHRFVHHVAAKCHFLNGSGSPHQLFQKHMILEVIRGYSELIRE